MVVVVVVVVSGEWGGNEQRADVWGEMFSPEVRHCSLTYSTVRDVGPVAKVGMTRERGSSQEEKEERLRQG